MKADRSLLLLLVFVSLLAVLSVLSFLLNIEKTEVVPSPEPADVLRNYFLAVYHQSNYLASNFLAEGGARPDFSDLQRWEQKYLLETGVEIGETSYDAQGAHVNVRLIYWQGGFAGEFKEKERSARLVKQGAYWKVYIGSGHPENWLLYWYSPYYN